MWNKCQNVWLCWANLFWGFWVVEFGEACQHIKLGPGASHHTLLTHWERIFSEVSFKLLCFQVLLMSEKTLSFELSGIKNYQTIRGMKFECEVTYGFRIVSLKIANLRNKTNWDFFPAKNDMWNDMWMKIENIVP